VEKAPAQGYEVNIAVQKGQNGADEVADHVLFFKNKPRVIKRKLGDVHGKEDLDRSSCS
jgi:hypothetical protein